MKGTHHFFFSSSFFFLFYRFDWGSFKNELPGWVRQNFMSAENFGLGLQRVTRFFLERAEKPIVTKALMQQQSSQMQMSFPDFQSPMKMEEEMMTQAPTPQKFQEKTRKEFSFGLTLDNLRVSVGKGEEDSFKFSHTGASFPTLTSKGLSKNSNNDFQQQQQKMEHGLSSSAGKEKFGITDKSSLLKTTHIKMPSAFDLITSKMESIERRESLESVGVKQFRPIEDNLENPQISSQPSFNQNQQPIVSGFLTASQALSDYTNKDGNYPNRTGIGSASSMQRPPLTSKPFRGPGLVKNEADSKEESKQMQPTQQETDVARVNQPVKATALRQMRLFESRDSLKGEEENLPSLPNKSSTSKKSPSHEQRDEQPNFPTSLPNEWENSTQSLNKTQSLVLSCMICYSTSDEGKTVSSSKCGHIACQKCWETWLKREHRCPMCKKNVKPKDLIKLFPAFSS